MLIISCRACMKASVRPSIYSHLGQASMVKGEFDRFDLDSIREVETQLPLREWESDDYDINFIVRLDMDFMMLTIKNK